MREFILTIVFSAFLLGHYLSAQSVFPGGVKGAKIWKTSQLKEDGNVHLVGMKNNTQLADYQPVKKWTTLNFNPCFSIKNDQTSLAFSFDKIDLSQASIFTVYQTVGKEKCIWYFTENGRTQMVLSTHRFSDLEHFEYLNFEKSQINVPIINTYFHHRGAEQKSGKSQLKIGTLPNDQQLPIQSFTGLLPEIIVFDRVLSSEERLRIESYLSLKYGTTLTAPQSPIYLNARGEVIWKNRTKQYFSNRIAGIGRDDLSGLWQPRSGSSYEPGILSIAFADSHKKSKKIPDQTFLIWGDNNQEFSFTHLEKSLYFISNRKWQIQPTEMDQSIPTNLQIATHPFQVKAKDNRDYVLLIDRSGTGDFSKENIEKIPVTQLLPDDQLLFENIEWDSDRSGADAFAIGIQNTDILKELSTATDEFSQFELFPNPSHDGNFSLKITSKIRDKAQLEIYNAMGQLIDNQHFSDSNYFYFSSNLPKNGIYLISFTQAEKTVTQKLVVDFSH